MTVFSGGSEAPTSHNKKMQFWGSLPGQMFLTTFSKFARTGGRGELGVLTSAALRQDYPSVHVRCKKEYSQYFDRTLSPSSGRAGWFL